MAKLLIYIPSYNRYELVFAQLKLIVADISSNNISDVNVYVNDNCSSDNRYLDLPRHYKQDYVEIHRNEVNIGLVGNLIYGFQLSGWDYIWVLSDDDILKSDSVSIILNQINESRSEFNNFFYLICGIKGDSSFSHGDVVTSREEYVSRFGTLSMMGLISANIYPAAIREYVPYMYLYGYSLFPHVAGVLKCMGSDVFRLKCIGGQLVEWRPGNRSYDEVVSMAYLNVVDLANLIDDRSEKAKFVMNHIRQFGASHFFPFLIRDYRQFLKALGQVGVAPMIYCFYLFVKSKVFRAFRKFYSLLGFQ